MNKRIVHIVVALLVSFLLLVVAGVVPFWMPMMDQLIVLVLVAVLLTLWAAFVMLEGAGDEREVVLKMQAGRIAYLSGIGVLSVALVYQGVHQAIDPWIAVALIAMVIAKLIARWYTE